MAENTRSQDFRRLEDTVKESLKDIKEILAKMQVQDSSISALTLQQNQIMSQLQHDQGNQMQNGGSPTMGTAVRGQYFSTRQSKVDFPHFNGSDLNGWLYKCQQFFEVDGTPQEAKVNLAAINLEGRALQWHQNWVRYRKEVGVVTWETYVQALESRFGELAHGDPMAELLKIKQTGSGTVLPSSSDLLRFVNLINPGDGITFWFFAIVP